MAERKSALRAIRRAYIDAAAVIIALSVLASVITTRAVITLERRVAAVTVNAEPNNALTPLAAEINGEALTVETAEPVSRYAGITLTEQEEYMLACLVYHEARGEPFEGQAAVVEVVFNRILSPYFPDTVEEVVFQKYGKVWQFSPAPYLYTAEPNEESYNAVWTAYRGQDPVTTLETVYFSTKPYNEHISRVIGGHYFCEID